MKPDSLDRLNTRHLRTFREVALRNQVKAAAENIFLTQSAVTQAIAKLESITGAQLFSRRHNGMFATDAGELFLQRTQRFLNYLTSGLSTARRIGEKVDNHLPAPHGEPHLSNAQLRALFALQHNSSYSAAARQMGVSQPAVHRAAKEMQSALNLRLFEHTSHGLSLTRAGGQFCRYARLAQRELELAFQELAEFSEHDSGKIIIGSMPLARTHMLPFAINRISELRPETSIEIIDGPYDDLLVHLLNGEIDFLIGAMRHPSPSSDIHQEPLFSTPLSVVCRSNHPLANETNISVEMICKFGWVVPRTETPARNYFDRLIGEYLPKDHTGLIETSSHIMTRELLLKSNRLTFISRHQIETETDQGLLKILPIDLGNTNRPIGITSRSDWHPTPLQKLFLSVIRDYSRQII